MANMIYTTGNQGKTIFCYYLASQLAHLGEKVVVVSTDGYQSVASTLFSGRKSHMQDKSIGKVLSTAMLRQEELLNNLIVLDDNLGYLSYSPNENHHHYPDLVESNIQNMVHCLSDFTKYIIVDGSHYPTKLDRFLSQKANKRFLITSADVRGLQYKRQWEGNLPSYIWVLCTVNKYNPVADFQPSYTLPYCRELEPIYSTVDIVDIPIPKRYAKVIYKIIKEELLCKPTAEEDIILNTPTF